MHSPKPAVVVTIDTTRISNWDTFHLSFAEAFGFPDFYGGNMNAWIDCMTCLDDESAGMSEVQCAPGSVVTIKLTEAADFAKRCPAQCEELIECAAIVNWRRLEKGESPVLALAFHK